MWLNCFAVYLFCCDFILFCFSCCHTTLLVSLYIIIMNVDVRLSHIIKITYLTCSLADSDSVCCEQCLTSRRVALRCRHGNRRQWPCWATTWSSVCSPTRTRRWSVCATSSCRCEPATSTTTNWNTSSSSATRSTSARSGRVSAAFPRSASSTSAILPYLDLLRMLYTYQLFELY